VSRVPWSDRDAQRKIGRLERLIGELETLDGVAGATALEAAQTLVEVYGEGLARIVTRLAPPRVLDLAEDEMVAHLLLVHGLHPLDLPTRIARALDEVRPYLQSHSGEVELEAIEPPTVRLRLKGSCHGCPSSTVTLKLAIEAAIRKAAPEIEHVDAGDGTVVRPDAPELSCPEPLGMALPMVS
jgi:Fe-S cluster biogenesis protein NfuA